MCLYTEYQEALLNIDWRDGINSYLQRRELVRRFSWGIITSSVAHQLRKYSPFLEIGAGNGYWSYELNKFGSHSIATDRFYPCNNPYGFLNHSWVEVLHEDAVTAVRKYSDGRTLLCVWPSYDQGWADHALRFYHRQGGQKVVYCGEGPGGCTADDRFHKRLARDWAKIEEIENLSWGGIYDRLTVWRRK